MVGKHMVYESTLIASGVTKGSATNGTTKLYAGVWSQLIVARWSGVDVLVNPYSGDTTRTVRVTAYQDVDIAVRHPQAFGVVQDAVHT